LNIDYPFKKQGKESPNFFQFFLSFSQNLNILPRKKKFSENERKNKKKLGDSSPWFLKS
jgi:hypothetical protein